MDEIVQQVLLTFEAPQQCEACGNVGEKVITLKGKLADYSGGLWRLETEDGRKFFVPKHSIKIIEEVKNGK